MDRVVIKKLCVRASITSCSNPIYQPILISISIPTDVTAAAAADDLRLTIDYAKLSADIKLSCDDRSFATPLDLVDTISKICPIATKIVAEQPRGFFRASSLGIELTTSESHQLPNSCHQCHQLPNSCHQSPLSTNQTPGTTKHVTYFINDLLMSTIIGVHRHERDEKQFVIVDIKFSSFSADNILTSVAYHVATLVEASHFLTVEKLALTVATSLQANFEVTHVTVGVTKPKALTFAEGAGVEVTRSCAPPRFSPRPNNDHGVVAYIAFGSNIEPRIDFISKALKIVRSSSSVTLLDTSFLYESLPMYFLEQANFYNGVFKIRTKLEPLELLHFLKNVENAVGRQERFENGPREIDLDILFYGNVALQSQEVTIPHPRVGQREFVLRPLLDIWENSDQFQRNFHPQSALQALLSKSASSVVKVLPMSPSGQLTWNSKTFVMGILNVSPDSFSEPGVTDPEEVVSRAMDMVTAGADIIDIGAVSRSPRGTEAMSTEDEITALTTVIRLLRDRGLTVPISIDVYKASVAEAAIDAGANIINDVGMGTRDEGMIDLAAERGVPIIFMHMRGTPADMHQFATYDENSVASAVISELGKVTQRAIDAGVYRWNIIIDPGIGFAKNGKHNMELLQNLTQFQGAGSPLRGFPLLIGCSRKRFIGTLTGVEEPAKRIAGTLASTSASISVGADVVRVHDIAENVQVAKFSDAFWRKK